MGKIQYTNKANLNTNPEIPAENKVSAADMNEIKTVVNGLDDDKLDKTSSVYSTTEVDTEKNWTNGKKIYRKIVETQTLSTDLGTEINLQIATNIDNLTYAFAYLETENHIRPLPILAQFYKINNDFDLDRQTHILYLNLLRDAAESYSTAKVVCIIEYTKVS